MGKIHAAAYMRHPDVEVVAACDAAPGLLEDFVKGRWGDVAYEESLGACEAGYEIGKAYADYRELAADPDVDAVSICIPNAFHGPVATAMMQAGKHVLVEKPLASDTAECEELVALAARQGVVLCTGFMWRFHPDVEWARQVVASGLIGDIVKTKSYGVHVNWAPAGWFVNKDLAKGGALIDMGVHAIDTTRYVLGNRKASRVWADVRTCYGDWEVDDTALLVIEFEGGVTSLVEAGWNHPFADGGEASTQIWGTRGYLRIFPTEARYRAEQRWGTFTPAETEPHQSQAMYEREVHHFVDCVRHGTSPRNSGEDGLEATKIMDAAYASAREKRPIDLR
jgi:predicted dehydrogenase